MRYTENTENTENKDNPAEVKEPATAYRAGVAAEADEWGADADAGGGVDWDIEEEALFQMLQRAEARWLAGAKTYTVSEVSERLQEIINGKN